MSSHRREVRPRYGRIAVLSAAVTVSLVAALAGLGVLSAGSADAGLAAGSAAFTSDAPVSGGPASTPTTTPVSPPTTLPTSTPTSTDPSAGTSSAAAPTGVASSASTFSSTVDVTAIPAASGHGRRIVFSQSLQRVWLVGSDNTSQRTYLASGSLYDNLHPGTYAVTGRQRHAIGIDDSGTMQYFVVFTAGPTGAAIGFHSIPVKDGQPLQTKAELGTPTSHGCIRQTTPDAIALWHFAPIDTKVVVVA